MADEKKAPAPAAGKKKEGETRLTSAKKRDLQSKKRRLSNRAYESKVHTSIRNIEKAVSEKAAPEAIKAKLSTLYSLMDKGVKKGVYKKNKAARTKSRMLAKAKV